MTVVGVTVGYVWLTASAWSSHSALTAPHSASHAPHMCLPAPPSALTVPHRPSHALTCPHRSHRSHSHPTGVSQVSHRFLKEPHRHLTGVRPPSSPKTANFPPKCVDSLPPPMPPPPPPESLPQSLKTEDGLCGEPAPSAPPPPPSLSSMSDSFLKTKFDLGDRSSVPGVQGKVWSWQVLLRGHMGTPWRPHRHPIEAAWRPHGGRMEAAWRPHGHRRPVLPVIPHRPHRHPTGLPGLTGLTGLTCIPQRSPRSHRERTGTVHSRTGFSPPSSM